MANLQNYKQVKNRMDDMINNFLGSKILAAFTIPVLLEAPFLQYHLIYPNPGDIWFLPYDITNCRNPR
jgi:hypothetical protein